MAGMELEVSLAHDEAEFPGSLLDLRATWNPPRWDPVDLPEEWLTTPPATLDYVRIVWSTALSALSIQISDGDLIPWMRKFSHWTLQVPAAGSSEGITYRVPLDDLADSGDFIVATIPLDESANPFRAAITQWRFATDPDPITLTFDDLIERPEVEEVWHTTIRFAPSADGRFAGADLWTGEGVLELDGVAYQGTDLGGQMAMEVSRVEAVAGSPDIRARVRIGVSRPATRRVWEIGDPGPLLATIVWIYSTDAGRTWNKLAWEWVGYTSTPKILDGEINIEIEPWHGDGLRVGQDVRYYSHESQMARFPGDTTFEHMRAFAAGKQIRTPP